MSEKDKMQATELAKMMGDAPLEKTDLSYIAGLVQGMKMARTTNPADESDGKENKAG